MQSVIEAILLQISPPVREVVWVGSVYCCNRFVYAEHVFLHCLIIPLLDLIQGPDHGIIVLLVAKCSLHVHQQVPHRDVLTFIQGAGPFTRVPTKTGEDVGVHTGLTILLQKGIHVETPECVHHLCPGSVDLKSAYLVSLAPALSFPYSPCSLCAYAGNPLSRSQWSICWSLVLPYLGRKGANPLNQLGH